jgi:hypothetical protein
LTVSPSPETVIDLMSKGGRSTTMTGETLLTNLDEFTYEISSLVVRCDLNGPDIAAALVAAAVYVAASDGCDTRVQMQSIVEFADNAITRLERLSESGEVRH